MTTSAGWRDRGRGTMAVAIVATLVSGQAMLAPVVAWAVDPPSIDPGALPPDDTPGPSREMRQSAVCRTPVVIGDPDVAQPSPANVMLNVEEAWKFSTGNGVTVALIDTGVTPNPRFPNLFAGGDYIQGLANGGLTDCDGHGTVVASIIGAAPSGGAGRPAPMPPEAAVSAPPPAVVANPAAPANPLPEPPKPTTVTVTSPPPPPPPDGEGGEPPPDTPPASGDGDKGSPLVAGPPPGGPDGVVGVAPDARLISIRQSSLAFNVVLRSNEPAIAQKAGDIMTLARAVRHAADLGAKVINISVAACINAATPVDQAALGAAVRYAALDKDAVVVAAAGNRGNSPTPSGGSDCGQNPEFNALNPSDPRDWAGVHTIVSPAWFSPWVLSVGAVTPEGQPLAESIAGPWVGVAAPGFRVMGLANTDGAAINAFPSDDPGKGKGLWGTSFSAAFVSGVAALVRARFPELTAHQVIRRIVETAHHPARGVDNTVGAGVVDPVAALTYDVEPGDAVPVDPITDRLVPAPPAPAPDDRPRNTALVGAAAALGSVAAAAGVAAVRRRWKVS